MTPSPAASTDSPTASSRSTPRCPGSQSCAGRSKARVTEVAHGWLVVGSTYLAFAENSSPTVNPRASEAAGEPIGAAMAVVSSSHAAGAGISRGVGAVVIPVVVAPAGMVMAVAITTARSVKVRHPVMARPRRVPPAAPGFGERQARPCSRGETGGRRRCGVTGQAAMSPVSPPSAKRQGRTGRPVHDVANVDLSYLACGWLVFSVWKRGHNAVP